MELLDTLRLNARLEDLPRIRQFVTQAIAPHNIDESQIYDFNLALTELITNTLSYGYRGAGPIQIEILRANQDLMVRLRDEAPHFNPTEQPSPDISLTLDQRPPGGMGIFLTQQSVDRFTHHDLPGGGNEIKLWKKGIFSQSKEEGTDADQN
jgi:anti-sigma regulatory factor (Ser/Thr protein kinase)